MSTNSTEVLDLKWIRWHVYDGDGDDDNGDYNQTALQVNFGKGEFTWRAVWL